MRLPMITACGLAPLDFGPRAVAWPSRRARSPAGCWSAAWGGEVFFWAHLTPCAIGIYLTLRSVPPIARAKAKHHLDPLGQLLAILAVGGLTCSVIEKSPVGHRPSAGDRRWYSRRLGSNRVLFAETKSNEPMLPFEIFRLPNFSPAVIFGTFMNLSFYGIFFVLSLYLEQARGYSTLRTGLAYLPLMCTFIVSNVASGVVGSRMGPACR